MKGRMTPRLLVVLCLLVSRTYAQEEPVVQTELLALALGEPMGELYFQTEGNVQALNFGMVGLGQPVRYQGPVNLGLCLTREKAGIVHPPENPEPPPADHRIFLHPPADRMLLLGHKLEGGETSFQVIPLPTETFRPGQYLFFNLSGHRLRVRIGPDFLTLEPGRRTFLQPSPTSGDDPDLDVMIATEIEGEMKLIFSSVVAHDTAKRNLIFLFNGRHPSMPVRLRFLHDRVKPASEAAK